MSESKLKKTLDRYKKPELIDKLLKSILSQQEQKKDSDAIITKLEDKIKKQNKEIKELRARSVEVLTEKDIIQEVLSLKATGKNTIKIYEMLSESRGVDISILEVRSICDSIDDLSEEMKSFYNSQKKLYFSNLNFNKENMVQEDVLTISGMIESSRRTLENMDSSLDEEDDFNFDNYRKLQDHISKLIKEKNNILKSLSGDGDDEEDDDQYDIEYVSVESEELDLEVIEQEVI